MNKNYNIQPKTPRIPLDVIFHLTLLRDVSIFLGSKLFFRKIFILKNIFVLEIKSIIPTLIQQ